jgi:catechol 2,3-dioxygenase-like lactoylglutathione lyase family enzyme
MFRLHVHVSVPDLQDAIAFYSDLFSSTPASVKDGYAKWMLDNPPLNFAASVSSTPDRTGLDHLGLQAETKDEFEILAGRLRSTGRDTLDEPNVHCCFAISDKSTVIDPAGLEWETFVSRGPSPHWKTRPVEPGETAPA